jgi:TRAP-type uncharacterized transport system substrate-binding protein
VRDPGIRFAAEWGTGPAFIICGWLAAGLRQLGTRTGGLSLELTPGTLENLHLLGQGKVDVTVTLPPLNVRLAREGRGPFGTAYPDLTPIGKLPHRTLFTFIVSADLPVRSIGEIRQRRLPLRIGSRLEPHGSISFVAAHILKSYGLAPRDLEGWGGAIVPTAPAHGSLQRMLRGEVDALLHQAGEKIWSELAHKKAVRFLPLDEELVAGLEREYHCTPAAIARGQFAGVEEEVRCLEWSHLVAVASKRLPVEVGYALARVMTERRSDLEDLLWVPGRAYSHLTAPIRPADVFRGLGSPLHAGAERWARENGYPTD